MKTTINVKKDELMELCFSLFHDKLKRTKTGQKNFENVRRKLLNEFKKLEKNDNRFKN